jgi:hypothetical protein
MKQQQAMEYGSQKASSDVVNPRNMYIFIYYKLQLSCHSAAVVFALVQTKQIRINVHKRNNKKTQYIQCKIQVHILTICPPNPHTHTRYKTS